MLYTLFAATCVASILIRWIALQLPNRLQHSWTKECFEYLRTRTTQKLRGDCLIPAQKSEIKWWCHLPFSSAFWQQKTCTPHYRIRFFLLDIFLFSSSLVVCYHFDSYLLWGSALIFTWLLIASSFIDFEHQILPDEITYILLWIGLIASCGNLYTSSTSAILGALTAYLSLFIVSLLFRWIRKKEGIGQGDLKLFAAIVAWTGIIYLPLILFLASVFALIFIVARKVVYGGQCSDPISFGPFIALTGWLVLLWGDQIITYLPL